MSKFIKLFLLSLGLFVFGAVTASTGYQGVLLNPEKSIKPFELVDDDGKNVIFPSAEGKYQLVFFGYTSCPDICPMTLQKVKSVINTVKNSEAIKFYFVSIDGDRDKPKQIKQFVDYFHPDIIGLTGNVHNVKKVEKEFGILTRKFQGKSAFAYKLEHSVFMYLLNKQGKLMLMYPGTTTTKQMVSDLNNLLASPVALREQARLKQ